MIFIYIFFPIMQFITHMQFITLCFKNPNQFLFNLFNKISLTDLIPSIVLYV